MTFRPARSTPGNPGRSACSPASSCRARANRSTSASSISRSRTPTPGARTPPTRTTLRDRRRVRGVVRDVLQRLPRQLLAALVDARVGGAARRADRHARVDVYRSKATGARITVEGAPISAAAARTSRAAVEFEIGLDPFEDGGWIWFDITTDSPRSPCTAPAGTRRCPRRARANVAVGIPTFNRPGDCVNALRRADVGSVGGRGDRRGHRVRPGHQEGASTTRASPRPPPRWATGCRSTTSPTSAAPAATAG